MRLPLTVASRPSEEISYPSVVLRPGRWVVESNHSDSHLTLSHYPDVALQNGLEFRIDQVTETSLICQRRGSESSITVYLCLCR